MLILAASSPSFLFAIYTHSFFFHVRCAWNRRLCLTRFLLSFSPFPPPPPPFPHSFLRFFFSKFMVHSCFLLSQVCAFDTDHQFGVSSTVYSLRQLDATDELRTQIYRLVFTGHLTPNRPQTVHVIFQQVLEKLKKLQILLKFDFIH